MACVSIVIPTYNRAHCLGRAVRSVLAQDFDDWELIIVNDGSTDSTKDLLGRLQGIVGDRLIRIETANGGVSKARNAGVARASGEWIAFLDSDDVWLPHKIGFQLQVAEAQQAEMVFTDHFEFTDRSGVIRTSHEFPDDMCSGVIYPQLLEVRCNVITCPSVLLRRSVFEEIGGFDEGMKICEDIDLWRRAARARNVAAIRLALTGVHIRDTKQFPYSSSLRGRSQLYVNARRDDPSLEQNIPQYCLELARVYRNVADKRADRAALSIIEDLIGGLSQNGVSASESDVLLAKAINALGSTDHQQGMEPQ